MSQVQEVVLAEPRGFCAGVDRAIDIVDRALEKFGAPVYAVSYTHLTLPTTSRV